MNLLAGLEKFGLDISKGKSLFVDEDAARGGKAAGAKQKVEEKVPVEEDFLLDKKMTCKVCDKPFTTRAVKNGSLRRLESDPDLRPRFQFIDTLKYDVTSCPHCGYTAMSRYFDQISPPQAKFVREEICAKFTPGKMKEEPVYTYNMALDRYKLSLMNTIVKRGKISERAYTCLKIAWILRDVVKELPETNENEKVHKANVQKEQEEFYQQAYEGFQMAMSKEMFPMCGMDQNTMDYLLANMSFHFGRYEMASKCLANVISSSEANRKMKDKALDLKEKIVAEMRRNKQQEG